MKTRAAVVLLSIALAGACENDAGWMLESHESKRYSFTEFLGSIEQFPYTAEEPKLSRVKEGFSRLAPGMRKDDVRKLMGEPDAEMLHYKPAQKGKEFTFSTWAYYLKRFERERFKEGFDQAVFLYFKPNDEMYWADPGDVPGLKAVGSQELYPEAMTTINR